MDNKTMPEKHMFSYSWVGLSDINALQYVEYLIVHYADFDITVLSNDEITIGDSITIVRKSTGRKKLPIFAINNRTFDAVWDRRLVSKLFNKCKKQQKVR